MPLELKMEQPTREAGLDRLEWFVPHAGRDYAATRNSDQGLARSNVSSLSPWVRHRLVLEQEVVRAVLAQHSPASAEKFIQEVVWRTYWKGWLQMRPQAWQDYRIQRDEVLARLSSGQQQALQQAEASETGIDCFDSWSQELVNTGYLHNHTRMWFASIWIFTLQLPWQLGADFFLRHLLDGDPASNTLSWRWVAGLQTVGKPYLARADNIRKFTGGRFNPSGKLNESAAPLPPDPPYPKQALQAPDEPDNTLPTALLICEEDLHPESLDIPWPAIKQVVAIQTTAQRSPRPVSSQVVQFVDQALDDCCQRVATKSGHVVQRLSADELASWVQQQGIQQLITAQIPVGPSADALEPAFQGLQQAGIQLSQRQRPWDTALWPHATHGYFRFKQVIPEFIRELDALRLG